MSKEAAKHPEPQPAAAAPPVARPRCGIVMPISTIENLPVSHWAEVKSILLNAIADAGFDGDLVSDAEDVGTIHNRILQRLYEDPIVVCDVSAKNANVMFELGIRLTFDKPTIIVKDDQTGYSFDTSPIEHVAYPRDLRYAKIEEFKRTLTDKIKATHAKAQRDPNFSIFLRHFGTFTVAKLENKEVSANEFLLAQISEVRSMVQRLIGEKLSPVSIPIDSDIEAALRIVAILFPNESRTMRERLAIYLNERHGSRLNFMTVSELNEERKNYLGKDSVDGVEVS